MEIAEMEKDVDVDKILEELQSKDYFVKSDNSFDVIILKINNPAFKLVSKNSYDIKILGKSMLDWVKSAVEGFNVKELECEITSSIFDVVKPYLTNSKYTIILYADTPLLTKNTINDIVTYVIGKGLKVCKLNRGYVFDTEYLKTCEKVYSLNTYSFNEQDFMPAINFNELNKITAVLQYRIIEFHLNNGVQLIKPETLTIEADVVIGNNVVIYPFNELIGETAISDNVILYSGNTIIDSLIFKNTTIEKSYINKSVIKEDCNILPFCNIYNNSLVNAGNTLASTVLNHKEIKWWLSYLG